jgi:hypothetical protein
LGAIYLLDKRSDDARAPFVQPLDASEAMISLIANTYGTKLLDKHMRAREFELLSRVVAHVPLRRVTPHTDPDRLANLCHLLLDDFEQLHV